MSNKARILITRRHLVEIESRLKNDYEIILNEDDHIMSADEIIDLSEGMEALFICVTEPLTKETIELLPESVSCILTLSVGTDHIDLDAAKERGLAVLTTPGAVTDATAEIGMMLLLGAARLAHASSQYMREGNWKLWSPRQFIGVEITKNRLGIYGMGRIGQTVARRARGFEMSIHYHNRKRLTPELEEKSLYIKSVEEFLSMSKFLLLSAPSTHQTQKFINEDSIKKLPPGAIIVNIGRGDLVDDNALINALESGEIAAAGLDVFNGEPTNIDPRYFNLKNVFMMPHIGSAAVGARKNMGMMLLDGFEAYRSGREVPNRAI
ncbi:MAG: D-glycerate dehydrogenase [Alphaproteobacteria bacterium]|jgi:lactate dehydrogenase-like 2-hydroxyacid dehydrogenase|nr:D-glycerate dehydrogenase [Alphaproteobacteria bacterium]PPR13874.1 MAG: Glycerate dehydrogenase [Alphaproteobacteria bacterium MarineAlpha12_Bin1]|tara:strand:- start:1688 stop:2656 length:969 start_codon:yes stop_codon:yes gene_type:complete